MKVGARIAVGIAIGYFLGRTKKMRLAITLVAAGATGRLTTNPGELVRQGTQFLSSTPEMKALTEDMRGRLLEAGKVAATAAASRQINSLSDRLQNRAENLRGVGVLDREDREDEESENGRYARERDEDETSYEEDNGDLYEEEEEEQPRRRSASGKGDRRTASSRGRQRDEEADEEEGYEDEEFEGDLDSEDEPPAKPARRSPVRRAGGR